MTTRRKKFLGRFWPGPRRASHLGALIADPGVRSDRFLSGHLLRSGYEEPDSRGFQHVLTGNSLLQTAQTVITDAGTNLSLSTKGCVITTSVLNNGNPTNNLRVTGQASQGNCAGISSKIGCFPPPASCGKASLPAEAAAALQANESLYITEIYYTYGAVTPVGSLLKNASILPAQLYDAAYY